VIAGTLELQILTDLARMKTDMDKATGIVTAAAGVMERAAHSAKEAIAGIAAGLTIGALFEQIKGVIEYAEQLNKLSQRAGIATEQLSQLQFAAKVAGVSSDSMTMALRKLNQSIAEGAAGDKLKAEAFRNLGVQLVDSHGKIIQADVALKQIADRFLTASDGAVKTEYALRIMGRAGDEMIPMLNRGGKSLQDMMEKADRLGVTISTEFAKKAEEFNDHLIVLNTSSRRLFVTLGTDLVDALGSSAKAAADAAEAHGKLAGIMAGINELANKLFDWEGKQDRKTIDRLREDLTDAKKQLDEVSAIWNSMSKLQQQGVPQIAQGVEDATQKYLALQNALQQVLNTYYRLSNYNGAGRGVVNPTLLGPVPSMDAQKQELTPLASGKGENGETQLQSLIKTIREHIQAQQDELEKGRALTEQEKLDAKVHIEIQELMAKYPGLSAGLVNSLVAESDAHARAISARNADLQNNANYAKDWMKTEEELAAAEKQRMDERDRVNKSLADTNRTLTDGVALLQGEVGMLGQSNVARALGLDYLRIEIDRKKQIDDIDRNLLLNADARAAAIAKVNENADLERQTASLRQQLDTWHTIDSTAHDVFMNIFSDGSNSFKKLGQVLKTEILELLYQMTVRRWVIQIVGNLTGSGGVAGAIGNAVGLGGGGSGGLLNTGSSLVSSSGMLGSIGGNGLLGTAFPAGGAVDSMAGTFGFGSGLAGAATTAGEISGLTGATEAGLLGAGAGAGEAAAAAGSLGASAAATGAGGFAAAGSMAAAAIPVIGWAIAAAGLLYSIFGQKSGGPKQDGRYGMVASGVAKYDKDLSPQNNAAAQQAAQGLQAQYDSIVSTFGGTGGIKYGLGFSTDPKGKSPTFLDITGSRDGQVVSNDVNLNVGRSQQELQAAIAKMGASAVLKGLQQSNIGGIIGGYLASLGDVATKSADEVTAALARLQKAGAEKQKLDETWYQLTHTAAEIQIRDRKNELDALDISNQAMQVRINALQDEIAAQQKAQAVYADVVGEIDNMRKSIGLFLDKLGATSAGLASPGSNSPLQRPIRAATGSGACREPRCDAEHHRLR
jgi:hypothetical protein